MESSLEALLQCSEPEFDKRITDMDVQALLETVTLLQKEMASEQTRFDDMTSRLGEMSDPESPEYETLSAELMAVQANLATLMARNMKCFTQQTAAQNKELLADLSEDTSSFNGSGPEVELRNGDSVRLLNGHKQRKTSPRPSPKASGRRTVNYDEGEPDVAGYEESFGSGDDAGNGLTDHHTGTGNGLSLEIVGGWDRRRDIHSPETRQEFIDFGEVGESTTDDLVTVEKNKKNEQNEARVDDREQLERKAFEDFESLMRFDSDPLVVVGDQKPKHPGRLFYSIDNATQGESYTDDDYKEIDVDRIGEEDEGEEDDPSEWKYAGDGDNKIPSGPIIHNTGATAKIFAETLARRLSAQSDDDDVVDRSQSDVYDIKRSAVTMVLRSRDGDVGGDSQVNGSSGPQAEVTSRTTTTTLTLAEASVSTGSKSPLPTGGDQKMAASVDDDVDAAKIDVSDGGKGIGETDDGDVVDPRSRDAHSPLLQAATSGGKEEGAREEDLPEGGVGETDAQQDRDQNSQPPDSASPAGIPTTSPGSSHSAPYYSDPVPSRQEQEEQTQEQEEELPSAGEDKPRVVLATSTATLTLSPAPQTPIHKDEGGVSASPPGAQVTSPGVKVVKAARISLRTSSSPAPAQEAKVTAPISWSSPAPAQEEPEPERGTEDRPASPTVASATASRVHFRSYASFAPSEAGEDDEEEADEASADDQGASGQQDDMGNALDGARAKDGEGDSVSVKSAVTPACLPSEGFTADDKVKDRTTLKDWDPTKLMQELYKIQVVPDEEEDFFEHISMEGYMEKLPINKKKATLLKTWKRRYFKAQDGHLYYYEPPDTVRPKTDDSKDSDRPSGSIQLMGGSVESLDNRMIGVDDGRGRYLIVRAPTDMEHEDWCRALKSQTIENIKATWVKPVVHAIPSRKRNVVIIDIGSCSVRAGILGEQPSLPTLFFPCIMATSRETGDRVFGLEALLPDTRANCTLSYPVRPSVKVDKFAVDMAAMPELFDKIFNELNIEPSNYWIMFSAPGNFSDKIKQHFMDILVNRFHVVGVNIVAQTLLSLYSYNSRSGIVVDVGERLEIVPVTDGYIVEAGVTRQPYGGHRITEALNSSFTESKYRFFTDVEFQIVRTAMEKSCYVAQDYNAEMRKSQDNPRAFKKTIHLEQYGLPMGTWKNVTHTQSRFTSTEGLFNTELWGMDNPMMHKLVAKAVQVCPMDLRREIWRSIFLSGGVTLLPGFAERLQAELTKLAPPTVRVQVHASPQRYHSAYIGACALANLKEFEQACITSDEWRETGPACLRKWHMY